MYSRNAAAARLSSAFLRAVACSRKSSAPLTTACSSTFPSAPGTGTDATKSSIHLRKRSVSFFQLRISAIFGGCVLFGTGLVALMKSSKREAIGRTAPTSVRTRQYPSGLPRGEPCFFAYSQVA